MGISNGTVLVARRYFPKGLCERLSHSRYPVPETMSTTRTLVLLCGLTDAIVELVRAGFLTEDYVYKNLPYFPGDVGPCQ